MLLFKGVEIGVEFGELPLYRALLFRRFDVNHIWGLLFPLVDRTFLPQRLEVLALERMAYIGFSCYFACRPGVILVVLSFVMRHLVFFFMLVFYNCWADMKGLKLAVRKKLVSGFNRLFRVVFFLLETKHLLCLFRRHIN